MESLLTLLGLLLSSIHKEFDYMGLQWAIGIGLFSIPIGLHLSKKMGFWFGLLSSYMVVSTTSFALYHYGKNSFLPGQVHTNMSVAGLETGFTAAIFFLAMYSLSTPLLQACKNIIPIYTSINALGVLVFWCMDKGRLIGGHGVVGPLSLDYSGMNGVLIALGTPFLIPKWSDPIATRLFKVLGIVLTCFGIVLSRSCIPYGVMAVCLVTYFINDIKRYVWVGVIPLIYCYFMLGNRMFQSSQRFTAYKVFLTGLHNKNWEWFGAGLGTFKIFAPLIQQYYGFMVQKDGSGYYWMWIHSDHLQTIFELGVVGYIIAMCCCTQGLLRLWRRGEKEVLTLGVGLLSAAVFDYPLRYFATTFLLVYFLVFSLRKDHLGSPTEFLSKQ